MSKAFTSRSAPQYSTDSATDSISKMASEAPPAPATASTPPAPSPAAAAPAAESPVKQEPSAVAESAPSDAEHPADGEPQDENPEDWNDGLCGHVCGGDCGTCVSILKIVRETFHIQTRLTCIGSCRPSSAHASCMAASLSVCRSSQIWTGST